METFTTELTVRVGDELRIESEIQIRFEEENDFFKFFGSPLPVRFANQTFVDEFVGLDLRLYRSILDASNNFKLSEGLRELLGDIMSCVYFTPGEEATISDFCKDLLRLVGFLESDNTFLIGRMKLEVVVGDVLVLVRPDLALLSQGAVRLVVNVKRGADPYSFADNEHQLVLDLIAAYVYNTKLGLEQRDMFGIMANATTLVFYRTKVTPEIVVELGNGGCEGVEAPCIVVRKYRLSNCSGTTFMVEDADNAYRTLQGLEAIRTIVSS